VLDLALRLGVPPFIAPLVAPAVDLSVIGLLLGIRYLTVHGASPAQLRPVRRLLIFSSAVTLALNVTDPVIAGQFGTAAFDAVGPLLLMGWVEVGPGLLRSIATMQQPAGAAAALAERAFDTTAPTMVPDCGARRTGSWRPTVELLERARQEDEWHRARYLRPISAESLRKRLRIGAARSRALVAVIRSEAHECATHVADLDGRSSAAAPPRGGHGTRHVEGRSIAEVGRPA
jgi:hypothetical protein